MDFSEAGELLPIIIELKRLGMEPDRLAWALWLAFRDMDMPSNLAYEDFAAAVRHQYEKSPAAGVPEGRAFAEAFKSYQRLLLYPFGSLGGQKLSLPRQALLERGLMAHFGMRAPHKVLFAGMESQLDSPEQRPYLELLSVLFGPKGGHGERLYKLEDAEAYMRAVELGRMPPPADQAGFAAGLLQSYQREHGLDAQWHKNLTSVIDRQLEKLPELERTIVRLRFGLQGEPQRKKREICEICGLPSEKSVDRRLERIYKKFRRTAAIRQLVPAAPKA